MSTFEYPPSFLDSRPLRADRISADLMRLRHLYFMTRLKLAMTSMAGRTMDAQSRQGLKLNIVSHIGARHTVMKPYHTPLSQEHVLISIGYCSVRGIQLPSPHFLQKLMSDFWPDEAGVVDLAGLFSEIIPGAKATAMEENFCRTIDWRTGWWWSNRGFTTFDVLNAMFWARLKQVFHKFLMKMYMM